VKGTGMLSAESILCVEGDLVGETLFLFFRCENSTGICFNKISLRILSFDTLTNSFSVFVVSR
jgi:hypothetical protein